MAPVFQYVPYCAVMVSEATLWLGVMVNFPPPSDAMTTVPCFKSPVISVRS